jgi:hypothetical protein
MMPPKLLHTAVLGCVAIGVVATSAGVLAHQEPGPRPATIQAKGERQPTAASARAAHPSTAEIGKTLVAVARQRFEHQMALYREGELARDRIFAESRTLMEAERLAGETEADRIAALRNYLKRAEQLEDREKVAQAAGRSGAVDVLAARAHHLEAELLLRREEERALPPPRQPPQPGGSPGRRANGVPEQADPAVRDGPATNEAVTKEAQPAPREIGVPAMVARMNERTQRPRATEAVSRLETGPAPPRELEIRLRGAQRLRKLHQQMYESGVLGMDQFEQSDSDVDLLKAQVESQRDQLRDEVELMAVQREGKRAELDGAEARYGQAASRLSVQRSNARAIDPLALKESEFEARARAAQRDVKKAELREVEARWNQAKRRLAQLERLHQQFGSPEGRKDPLPPPPSLGPPPAPSEPATPVRSNAAATGPEGSPR